MPIKTPRNNLLAIMRRLEENTGKTFEQWVVLLKKSGAASEAEALRWLKSEHGLGHFQASTVASHAFSGKVLGMYDDPDALAAKLYSGKRAVWKPLSEKLLALAKKQGRDVKINVCASYTSAYREHQFMLIRPKVAGLEVVFTGQGKLLVTGADDPKLKQKMRASYLAAG